MKSSAEIAMNTVLDVVSNHFGVAVSDIASRRRQRQVLAARRIAMYLAHRVCPGTAAEIGARLGYDYTNVLMALRAMQRLIDENPDHAKLVTQA